MAEYELVTPIDEEKIRKLQLGDTLYVSGTMITARDEAHKKALEWHAEHRSLPVTFKGNIVFHCGPIMQREGEKWKVVAAGPTTSTRMEIFQADFIRAFTPRMIVGKGGMGEKTTEACKEVGTVYAAFTGGAALVSADAVKEVVGVHWIEDLGMPECLWVYRVEHFGPMAVGIDAHGRNLFLDNAQKVRENKKKAMAILLGR